MLSSWLKLSTDESGIRQLRPERLGWWFFKDHLNQTFKRMAAVVDKQNAGDPAYQKMTGNFKTSAAYQAAQDLVFKGLEQPSGYTEPLLHAWRLKVKGE